MHTNPRARGAMILALLSSLLLVAAGCGGGNASSGGASAAGSGGSDKGGTEKIVIGATLPMSGSGAPYAEQAINGLKMAADEINGAGGVDGRDLEIVALDHQGQPATAISQTRQLTSDKHPVGIASMYAGIVLGQLPIAARAKVPVLNTGSNDPSVLGKDYLWNNILMIGQEATAGMAWAQKNLGVKKVAILLQTNYTPESAEGAKKQAEKMTGAPVAFQTVDSDATTVASQIDKLLAEKPDLIYLMIDGNVLSMTYKELAKRGVDTPVMGASPMLGVPEAFTTPEIKLYSTRQAHELPPAFMQSYEKKPYYKKGEPPSVYFMNCYVFVHVVKDALVKAIADGKPVTGESVNAVLGAGGKFAGGVGDIQFTPNHGVQGSVTLSTVKKGAAVDLKTFPVEGP
jgi:branched-chain amino acid transport system substrate-binding protein